MQIPFRPKPYCCLIAAIEYYLLARTRMPRYKLQALMLISPLQIVIFAGMALSLIPALTLQFFDDSKFLGPESDAILSAVPSTGDMTAHSH